ncbi:hypothetical protein [Cyanobium sp. Morenito 9A2]|uniref:hypothetical protein n=1 Tax=Cyanobium sp. Morenito 9A2 TaxID=2823718 RepID=UPI0020CEA49D|nr:hypothetical protein [Cyanobium sp. Morenito 9A2]MCP9849125.1 hypothetical protein [Cyanobium sp. Morenito 9A2]
MAPLAVAVALEPEGQITVQLLGGDLGIADVNSLVWGALIRLEEQLLRLLLPVAKGSVERHHHQESLYPAAELPAHSPLAVGIDPDRQAG